MPGWLAAAHAVRCPTMASHVLIDAERALMWRHLTDLAASGPLRVHCWGIADGLPHPSPVPAHQHAVPTLVLCLQGSVRVLGRRSLDLAAGEALVIEPGCWHDHLAHRRGSTSFGMGQVADKTDVLFFGYRLGLWGWVPGEPYAGLLERLMDATDQEQRLRLVGRLLDQVVGEQVRSIEFDDLDVLAMAAHLWNHLHDPLDAMQITGRCSSGQTKAFRAFKEFFTRTPKQELLHERLLMARHLLRRGMAIPEVAARCGFTSRSDLTRAFGRAFGQPPRASRRPA
jgi:AraC-like DNA-binding protein